MHLNEVPFLWAEYEQKASRNTLSCQLLHVLCLESLALEPEELFLSVC